MAIPSMRTPLLAPATIDALYAQEAPRIRRYLSRLVGAEEAEDLVQEVFARAHGAIASHRGEARLTTWLFRIATNAAIDHLRRAAPRHVTLARDLAAGRSATCANGCADPPEAGDCANVAPSAEAELIRSEMRRCIAQLVSSLPASSAAVLALGEIQGLKDREVADALGLSLEAVKIRLHRGRQRLRRLLEASCDLYHDERGELACDHKSAKP